MDDEPPLPDEMGHVAQATQEIIDMIDKMDGLSPTSAARSCRDVKLQDHNAPDGRLMCLISEPISDSFIYLLLAWCFAFSLIVAKTY